MGTRCAAALRGGVPRVGENTGPPGFPPAENLVGEPFVERPGAKRYAGCAQIAPASRSAAIACAS
ncbi:hypothetical protein DF141_05485 [Burkholderia cenocepacia]|nr:hypothetical protein AS149_18845 [Burkholderia cenocepacia]RQU79153.1 hypothetical protein DF141_05485 [Burkholderia cenocepacia]RQU89628.1 hypothetical protein DF133_15285 [Burkholderia cenocepacia]RQV66346.1 hypothetical protein DF018_20825 [Burkholderia cenocepacia]RRA14808.1 hypothetical protein DF059_17360 [Burkholderia cenocepacia]